MSSGRGPRRSNSQSTDSEEMAETKALFLKLFRANNKGNRIVVSSAPPNGNKLQSAIWDSLQALTSKGSDVHAYLSPLTDFTVMEVPPGFAMGNNLLALLKQIDDDYNVLSGNVNYSDKAFVVVIGALRRRRAAELKIMATVESKVKGFYSYREVRGGVRVCDQPWLVATEDFDTDSVPIPESELSFALGHKGSIRKKLAVASSCIIEYVGDVAYFAGTLVERTRGRDYLRWVLLQLEGEVAVPNYQLRLDIAAVPLRNRMAGYVNGNKGRLLRATEELSGTFCFVGKSTGGDSKPLIICGTEQAKEAAFFALDKYLADHQTSTWTDEGKSEETNSTEALKAQLEAIVKPSGLLKKAKDPWKVASTESVSYKWLCQPCPGAARKSAELLSSTDKSTVLLKQQVKKERQLQQRSSEFVNDTMAFPELGGSKRVGAPVPDVVVVQKPAEVPVVVAEVMPPSPPPPPRSESENAGIFIDRVKGEVWGDWGLGPRGDPEVVRGTAAPTAQAAKLMGAWK